MRELSREALEAFSRHDWPGNVRELEHVLEHAFVVAQGGVITPEELPPDFEERGEPSPAGRRKAVPESLLQALEKAGWNKSKAARILGVDRRTVYRKMEEFGIEERP